MFPNRDFSVSPSPVRRNSDGARDKVTDSKSLDNDWSETKLLEKAFPLQAVELMIDIFYSPGQPRDRREPCS